MRFEVKLKGRWTLQVMEKVNDNAYQIDLKGKYGVSVTLNVYELASFDANKA